jgi:hypothetical protein
MDKFRLKLCRRERKILSHTCSPSLARRSLFPGIFRQSESFTVARFRVGNLICFLSDRGHSVLPKDVKEWRPSKIMCIELCFLTSLKTIFVLQHFARCYFFSSRGKSYREMAIGASSAILRWRNKCAICWSGWPQFQWLFAYFTRLIPWFMRIRPVKDPDDGDDASCSCHFWNRDYGWVHEEYLCGPDLHTEFWMIFQSGISGAK